MEKEVVLKMAVGNLCNDGFEATYRDDYSGRGMCGKSVPAIVADCSMDTVNLAIMKAHAECLDLDVDFRISNISAAELVEEVAQFTLGRSDSMGRSSSVFY